MKAKVKAEVFPVQAVKAYGGSRGIAPLILNLGTRWRLDFRLPLHYPREVTPVPIE
jgi:hypothetical protein